VPKVCLSQIKSVYIDDATRPEQSTIDVPCPLNSARYWRVLLQEAPQEVQRLQDDVIAELPAVVIWQVGTNAVRKKQDVPVVKSNPNILMPQHDDDGGTVLIEPNDVERILADIDADKGD
jgi:hypothetical protein